MAENPEMGIEDMRSLFDEWSKATTEPEGVTYKTDQVGGVDVIWTLPVDADSSKVLLFTHGGGFAVGSADSHRKLAGHVAKSLNATSVVLDYRRAPENPYPAQLEDSVAVYKALLESGIKPANITTIGDSAGGNLAICSVLKYRDLGLPLPGSVIAFSPWIDMELSGETLALNLETDALVSGEILHGMLDMFIGSSATDNPLVNPLYADLSGFPPLYINAGKVETLLDDARRVHARATEAGVDTTLSVVDDMQHVFPFMAGRAQKADDEIKKITLWYNALSS